MFINHNGNIKNRNEPLFTAQNRGFRYGDGLFETLKATNRNVLLAGYHFDRLFTGLRLLQMAIPESLTAASLVDQINVLCRLNDCETLARVRLAVYRDETNRAAYVIEAEPLAPAAVEWNEKGWCIDVYPYTRKSCDTFSNLKTANYLPYVLAGMFARERGCDEALLLNSENHLCDGSKTNLFLIRENEIITPALHQGCVSGVMRRCVIDELKQAGFVVKETEVKEETLLTADEFFLTNAIQGIKWVERFRDKRYGCRQTKELHDLIFTVH